jgi:hypothetical protein
MSMNPTTFTNADESLTRHASQTGFMEGHQANDSFIAYGPHGFTALVLINLGGPALKMFLVTFICLAKSTDSKPTFLPLYPTAFSKTVSSSLSLARSRSPQL